MTRKTEMKDPVTIDSLLESKEQTDQALAELADELREKLARLEAVIRRPQTTGNRPQNTTDAFDLRIDKQSWTWFWRVVAFMVMSALIWGAMAWLKEPKANGKTTTSVPLEIIAALPDEPTECFEETDVQNQEPEECGQENGEESTIDHQTPDVSLLPSPNTVQRLKIRLFQHRP